MRQLSDVENLAPPPGWEPGSRVDIDLAELDSLDTTALRVALERSRSKSFTEEVGPKPSGLPPPLTPPHDRHIAASKA